MRTRAAVLHRAGAEFSVEDVEIEPPRGDEILVRIEAVGICHTDLVFASGAMGSSFPVVLGHEGAGVVEQVGEGIEDLAPGDKVLLTFDSCGRCFQCAQAQPAYCHEFTARNFACVRTDGSTPLQCAGHHAGGRFFGQSSFARHAIARRRNAIKVDADADLAMIAPLGCGVQTGVGGVLRSLAVPEGASIVIIGGGAVGLSAVLGARIAKAGAIILIEPRPERRALGLELGAQHVIDPATGDTTAAVRTIAPGGVNYVFDTSGVVSAVSAAMGMLAPRGEIGLVGVPGSLDAVLPIPLVPVITYGFTVKGIIEGDSDPQSFIPDLVRWRQRGDLPFDRFVRHYTFSDINKAIEDSHSGKCVKAVLTFGAD